ncbi:MAG: DsbA family protein [Hyphomicrobiales bacterium]
MPPPCSKREPRNGCAPTIFSISRARSEMDRLAVLGQCAASERLTKLRALRSLLMAGALLLPQAASAGEFTDKQREEIGAIVREYLLQHPDVLMEVNQELERRQKLAEEEQRNKAIAENADEIFRSSADFVAGNPQGDVTMVEFFDYNCPWCKKSMPIIKNLLETDGKLKVVFKEFPILGEGSEYAARASMASQAQGKYLEFHFALYEHAGKIDAQAVDEIAQSVGIDLKKLKADMESADIAAVIDRNLKLAQTLEISGTPAFVIGKTVIPGYLPERALAAAVKEVRDAGGCSIC